MDELLEASIANTLTAHLPAGSLTIELVRRIDRHVFPKTVSAVVPETLTRSDGSEFSLSWYQPAAGGEAHDTMVLWIHGGGLILGDTAGDDSRCQHLADKHDVVVASVGYGLSPEFPYPTPLEDCFESLRSVERRFENVIVIGASAGGCLAAGLALVARDRGHKSIRGLHLYYPMLDDRTGMSGSPNGEEPPVWDSRLNQLAWNAYLGGAEPTPYAAPARAEDLTDLPPTYMDTGEFDLFLAEDLSFATRLAEAGNDVRINVVSGAVHAYDLIAPEWPGSIAVAERRALELTQLLDRIRGRER
ncbi:MAG TPA: alpha/beta hydrolase [Steroidobacteraceae bacterium]|jgi:acetyl esterase/lipase